MPERGFMPKRAGGYSPMESVVDDIPFDRKEMFVRDQRKTALIAAGMIENRDELLDILEMLGLKTNRPAVFSNGERDLARAVFSPIEDVTTNRPLQFDI